MGETTSERNSSWAPASRRRNALAWAAVAAVMVLGWGAYAGTLLSMAGLDGWSGIACGGEYRPASCTPASAWRQVEMTITLAQLVALPILIFKGIRSASGAWFDCGWMLWLSAVLLICIEAAPLNNPYLSYLP